MPGRSYTTLDELLSDSRSHTYQASIREEEYKAQRLPKKPSVFKRMTDKMFKGSNLLDNAAPERVLADPRPYPVQPRLEARDRSRTVAANAFRPEQVRPRQDARTQTSDSRGYGRPNNRASITADLERPQPRRVYQGESGHVRRLEEVAAHQAVRIPTPALNRRPNSQRVVFENADEEEMPPVPQQPQVLPRKSAMKRLSKSSSKAKGKKPMKEIRFDPNVSYGWSGYVEAGPTLPPQATLESPGRSGAGQKVHRKPPTSSNSAQSSSLPPSLSIRMTFAAAGSSTSGSVSKGRISSPPISPLSPSPVPASFRSSGPRRAPSPVSPLTPPEPTAAPRPAPMLSRSTDLVRTSNVKHKEDPLATTRPSPPPRKHSYYGSYSPPVELTRRSGKEVHPSAGIPTHTKERQESYQHPEWRFTNSYEEWSEELEAAWKVQIVTEQEKAYQKWQRQAGRLPAAPEASTSTLGSSSSSGLSRSRTVKQAPTRPPVARVAAPSFYLAYNPSSSSTSGSSSTLPTSATASSSSLSRSKTVRRKPCNANLAEQSRVSSPSQSRPSKRSPVIYNEMMREKKQREVSHSEAVRRGKALLRR